MVTFASKDTFNEHSSVSCDGSGMIEQGEGDDYIPDDDEEE